MSRKGVIQLIHIARTQLSLDDETYRSMLDSVVPGKTSCRDMTDSELEKVIKVLEGKGFKRSPARSPTRRAKPTDISNKIRIVWRFMFKDGFLEDGSDAALDHWVQRITSQKNGGEGVASLSWLRGDMVISVLESLKQWHLRVMRESMAERGIMMPVSPVNGRELRDYDSVRSAFVATRKGDAK
ncbi:TPA: regulatory protein GemA [Enterobacter asburiae]|nr:regulatory protein GemA [Enterobacter asburiae]